MVSMMAAKTPVLSAISERQRRVVSPILRGIKGGFDAAMGEEKPADWFGSVWRYWVIVCLAA